MDVELPWYSVGGNGECISDVGSTQVVFSAMAMLEGCTPDGVHALSALQAQACRCGGVQRPCIMHCVTDIQYHIQCCGAPVVRSWSTNAITSVSQSRCLQILP